MLYLRPVAEKEHCVVRLKMSKNSLFAILLRSHWWISLLVALFIVLYAISVVDKTKFEELRVSLFAQELGARAGISPKKLAQRLAGLK